VVDCTLIPAMKAAIMSMKLAGMSSGISPCISAMAAMYSLKACWKISLVNMAS